MAGGARYKMNLDLTEEEFEKLSLADMNNINIRIAKRLNESVKRWEKKDEDVAKIIKVRYGEHPFTYKKAQKKRDAINRYNKAQNYIKKGFYNMKSYIEAKNIKNEQLAENTNLSFLSEADKNELGNFFSIMYDKLHLDAEVFNYRAVCNFFIDYKLTAGEQKDMTDFIAKSWNNFEKNNKMYSDKLRENYNKRIGEFKDVYSRKD